MNKSLNKTTFRASNMPKGKQQSYFKVREGGGMNSGHPLGQEVCLAAQFIPQSS